VLEAEGTVEIKFRHRDILATMARTDAGYIELQEKFKQPGVMICYEKSLHALYTSFGCKSVLCISSDTTYFRIISTHVV